MSVRALAYIDCATEMVRRAVTDLCMRKSLTNGDELKAQARELMEQTSVLMQSVNASPVTIIGVAIVICNGTVIASKEKPARHHDVLHACTKSGIADPGPDYQGFITSDGEFVGRKEAVEIALRAGQITLPKRCPPQDQLFSEDLW